MDSTLHHSRSLWEIVVFVLWVERSSAKIILFEMTSDKKQADTGICKVSRWIPALTWQSGFASLLVMLGLACIIQKPTVAMDTPSVILADEPIGNLDTKTGEEIIDPMKSLNREKGVTIICSTHDDKMLAASEHVWWIRDSSPRKIGTSDEIKVDALKT
jgi:hypothetical protein